MKNILGTILAVAIAAAGMDCQGLTMDELRNTPNLTPEKFAKQFRNFDCEYHTEVQDPGEFLTRQAGDCDDCAILASMIFAEKRYHPRLVSVRMNNISRVIVFFPETQTYLDFNNRAYFRKTARSDGLKEVVARETRDNRTGPGEMDGYLAAQ